MMMTDKLQLLAEVLLVALETALLYLPAHRLQAVEVLHRVRKHRCL